jgi:hypothetical protein
MKLERRSMRMRMVRSRCNLKKLTSKYRYGDLQEAALA